MNDTRPAPTTQSGDRLLVGRALPAEPSPSPLHRPRERHEHADDPVIVSLLPEVFPDLDQVRAHFLALNRPGEVREVRILDHVPPSGFGGPATSFGYFDNAESLAAELREIGSQHATGIYITHNPVDPDLLARANNRLKRRPKHTTADADIIRRGHLTLDFDPVRKSGISATEAEVAQALTQRDAFIQFVMTVLGWPEPVVSMMSGNGGQATWRIAVPNESEGAALVAAVLNAACALFTTNTVTVDTTLSNPSRIVKLSGTVAAKGDPLPLRPHRRAHSTFYPEARVVSEDQLLALVALAPEPHSQPRSEDGRRSYVEGGAPPYDVPGLLAAAGIEYREHDKPWGRVYELDRCLTSDDHLDGAAIYQFASGAVSYKCFHHRCAGMTWHDVKSRLGLPNPQAEGRPTGGAGSNSGAASGGARHAPTAHAQDSFALTGPRSPRDNVFTAATLQTKTFDPLPFAVPEILPQGAALLCGPPKIGKSRLVLQLACAVAYGGVALSHTEVARGGVLVLALEDGERRLQERLGSLLQDEREPWPDALAFVTEWPTIDHGGGEELDAYLSEHPDTRLVIVDVLQMIRPATSGKENAYAADYATMRTLKAVADRHDVTLLALHHTRKMDANDPLSLVSGTNGLAGAVDSVLILQREPNGGDATLYLRGRDVEERQFTLGYDRSRGAWNVAGEARAHPLSETRGKIIAALERAWPETMTPKDLSAATGLAENTVYQRLHHLEQATLIRRVQRGQYTLVAAPDETGNSAPADASPNLPRKDRKNRKDGDPDPTEPYVPYDGTAGDPTPVAEKDPRNDAVFSPDLTDLTILTAPFEERDPWTGSHRERL